MAASTAFFLLAVLAIFLQSSEALSCWECTSENDQFCNDPFDTSVNRNFIKECDSFRQTNNPKTQVCRKVVKLVGDEKKKVVVRSCAGVEHEHEGPCSTQTLGNPQHLQSCQTCNTNECNSAPGLALVSLLTLMPTAFLTIKQL